MGRSIRSTSGHQPRANWPLATLAAAVLAALPWQAPEAATKTWNDSDGSWTDLRWSGFGAPPSASDDAVINAGNAKLDTNRSISGFTLSGGSRSGTGTLTASTLTFNSGALSGSGATTIAGASTFNGANSQTIGSGHTLTLSGNSTWSQGNGSILNFGDILSYATFTDQGTATGSVARQLTNGTSGYFANVGTYVRQGAGTTVAAKFNNIGTLDVRQGTFKVVGDSGSPGNVLLATGTALEFAGGNSWLGGVVSGLGTVRVNGGSLAFNSSSSFASALELNGGTLDVQANQVVTALTMNGGSRSGAGNLTANSLTFNSGTLVSFAKTTVNGPSTFNGSDIQNIGGNHTLVLNGDTTWSAGNGSILNSGAITNAATSTFTDLGAGAWSLAGGTRQLSNGQEGVFNNLGTYLHTGQRATTVGVFNNAGVLQINSGSFIVTASSAFTGGTVLGRDTILNFAGGNSTITGDVSGGGWVYLTGGILTLSSTSAMSSRIELANGILDVQADKTIPFLSMSGGARSGSANLTASLLAFRVGDLKGSGTTTIAGSSTFGGDGNKAIGNGHTLTLKGGAVWAAGAGDILNSGTITNSADSTFMDFGAVIRSTRQLSNGNVGIFNNQGTYVYFGDGTTQVGVFNNSGVLNVKSGGFKVTGDSTFMGVTELSSKSLLEFAGGISTLSGEFSGTGSVRQSNGILTFNSSSKFAPSLTLSGGILNVQADKSVDALTIDGGARSGMADLIVNSFVFKSGSLAGDGATTIRGPSVFDGAINKTIGAGHNLMLEGDSVWLPGYGSILSSGATTNLDNFEFVDYGTISDAVALHYPITDSGVGSYGGMRVFQQSGIGAFYNRGTYLRRGVGSTYIQGLKNTGTLDIMTGEIMVDARFVNTGTVKISKFARLQANAASVIHNDGVVMGDGRVRAVLTKNYGLITPGAKGAIGTLTFQGALTLDSTSRLHIDLGAGGLSDLLAVSGNLTPGGTLELALGAGSAPQLGDVFTVATFGSLSPTSFSRLSWTDSNYGFELLYGTNELRVRVTNVPTAAVPEPETYALAMSGLLVAWLARRRMQRV
jgi:PEP-CTERM motif